MPSKARACDGGRHAGQKAPAPRALTPSVASKQSTWAAVASKGITAQKSLPALPARDASIQQAVKKPTHGTPASPTSSSSTKSPPSPATTVEETPDQADWDCWAIRKKPLTPEEMEQEKVQKSVKAFMEDYPWNDNPYKGILRGPFSRTGQFFKHCANTQSKSAMVQAFERDPDVARLILDLVLRTHDQTWKFYALCQKTFKIVEDYSHFWNITDGWFQTCDMNVPQREAVRDVCLEYPCYKKPPRNVIVVAPRCPRTSEDYRRQLVDLNAMTLACSNWANVIQTLSLYKVPFLTHEVLALVVPQMNNLKSLGVFQCQLMHVGHALNLLDIITIGRPNDNKHRVTLDFYPRFHFGPAARTGVLHGRYGVTWDSFNGYNNPMLRGIWALVLVIVSKAQRQGLDMVCEGSMFRKWLLDGPCWAVDETLAVLKSDKYRQARTELYGLSNNPNPTAQTEALMKEKRIIVAEFAAQVDCGNYEHGGSVRKFMSNILHRHTGWEWMCNTYMCLSCGTKLLGVFFQFNNIKIANDEPDFKCLGCQLEDHLNEEGDHFKLQKQHIIRKWLYNPRAGRMDTNARRAQWHFQKLKIATKGHKLDEMRALKIAESHDPELDERQRPWTHAELNTKTAAKRMRASEIHEKNEVVVDQWSACHGRHRVYANGIFG